MKRLFSFAIGAVVLGLAITAHAQDMSANEVRCADDSKYMMDATTNRLDAEDAVAALRQQVLVAKDEAARPQLIQAIAKLKEAQKEEKDLMDEMAIVCAQ